jgi:hypothetical protein
MCSRSWSQKESECFNILLFCPFKFFHIPQINRAFLIICRLHIV